MNYFWTVPLKLDPGAGKGLRKVSPDKDVMTFNFDSLFEALKVESVSAPILNVFLSFSTISMGI